MSWMSIATPPFDALEKFDEVTTRVGDTPQGLEARYVGRADDGTLRVVTVWETRADADRFFTDRLAPALAEVLGPEPAGAPAILGVDVHRSWTRQPA